MAFFDRHPLALALVAALGLCLGLGGVRAFTQAATGETITLRVIVVGGEDAAQTIAARLARGESFAILAKAESTAPSADDGGWLGRVADTVDDPVSIGLAVAVAALGWWYGRSAGGRPRQAHGA